MEDDEAAWEGWYVESNTSDDSGSWHDVQSDAEEAFDVSDSDDKSSKRTGNGKGNATEQKGVDEQEDIEMKDEAPRISTLATTKVSATSQFPEYER